MKTTAPWIRVTEAARESGVACAEIKAIPGITIRQFGNADYVATKILNEWILSPSPEAFFKTQGLSEPTTNQ